MGVVDKKIRKFLKSDLQSRKGDDILQTLSLLTEVSEMMKVS
jgi:hypothetical protein